MNLDFQSALSQVIEKIESWWETFVSMIPNMGVAILLLIIFVVLSRLAAKTFKKIFAKTSENKALTSLFTTIIKYTVIGIGLFIILSVLKLDKAVTSILAGVGILGLALGFAFQDIAANFVSGIILAFRTPFTIGDIIKVNDIMGTAMATNLRTTIVKTFTGQEVFIPNKDVLQNPIFNYTVLGKRRIDISVGISYGDDLDKVQAITLETIKNIDGVIDLENTVFDYEEFGGSSINFNIRFWISYPGAPGYFKVKTDAIKAIKKAFDDNDIMIPFPIRTLDFGIRGGEPLSAMQLNLQNAISEGEDETMDKSSQNN
ncbi:MAG: mechanosensitive ion channel family protein [Lentimicrobium sp.]|jgi:small conductance mechanosensitive channel|nr:mechanosensitive ion channel family protein [Lentimicrobium sp.]MDD2527085.1 mechanosensitive ion channel family protein [Lentimicrobiaceae bacterium]MDD4598479.1 mechanosensitive ion channel family protein [Lentimicrobiaceae bacterium]MDY0026559.1 mechanosensitive ion channel family protein [Lentimicrobium sp.]